MSAYRVQVENLKFPATSMSLFLSEGEVNTKWDAIMRIFWPGGVRAGNLPMGDYRVHVFTDTMNNCETSTYRFN